MICQALPTQRAGQHSDKTIETQEDWGSAMPSANQLDCQRLFPDGTVELVYSPA